MAENIKGTWPGSEFAIGLFYGDSRDPVVKHHTADAARTILEQTSVKELPAVVTQTAKALLVPLTASGTTHGLLAVTEPSGFPPPDRALFEIMGQAAGAALATCIPRDDESVAERRWHRTVDRLQLALCLIDGDGLVLKTNRAFDELFGPDRDLAGDQLMALVPEEWRDSLDVIVCGGELSGLTLESQGRLYEVSSYATEGPANPETIVMFEDQTERQRLQEHLVQSEKMSAIGQVIAGVAHDLNNPLASVVGFADFLLEAEGLPDGLRRPVEVIQLEAERAANLVRGLLTFARKHKGQRQPTDLARLLSGTLDLLRNDLASNGIVLRLEPVPQIPPVVVEPNQIQQVVVNIVTNAAQAMAESARPGEIVVSVRQFQGGAAIDVRDTGPGIPERNQHRVFEPFFTTKSGQGTGLGLSISQGIMREHGGGIVLTESGPGGTVFTLELPNSSSGQTVGVRRPAAEGISGLRILVVDDEPHILHYMSATLEGWGHLVTVARDGQAGLDLVQRASYDVIITDLRMPAGGGREFYAALVEGYPHLAEKVIFATGDTVRDDTLEWLSRQNRPCLHKPFSLAELRSVLALTASAERTADAHEATSATSAAAADLE